MTLNVTATIVARHRFPCAARQDSGGDRNCKRSNPMKRMTKILTVALMSSSFAAAPALAGSLDADAKAGVNSGSTNAAAGTTLDTTASGAGDLGLSTSTNVAAQAGASADEIVALINADTDAASDIGSVTGANDVTVVSVDAEADGSQSIDKAVNANQASISELRQSIQANADVSGKLEAEGVDVASVIAAQTGADGSLTVYVR
ncbi:hypothetical protein [Hoeflea marina]|nr:hypothetical protein [Hoeflea marina]